MALVVGGLPFYPELLGASQALSLAQGFGFGAGVLGVAYLVGVVFDRFADTLLQGHAKHNRIRFALKGRDSLSTPWADVFPEDRLRIEVMLAGDAGAEWMGYLRSRMRLARAVTVFAPGLTLSVMLALGRPE